MVSNECYETEFCKVQYLAEYNAVLCSWRGFCEGDAYRKPLEFGLRLIQAHSADSWIIDTVNGFESTQADTAWLIEEFTLKVLNSSCKKVIFLIDENSPLQDEIQAQKRALSEYFEAKILCELSEYTRRWMYEIDDVDWHELSYLYKIAPLGEKDPQDLKTVFTNSRYKCVVYDDKKLIGAGRALADGVDVSYIADVAIHPDYQNIGLGKAIVNKLVTFSKEHNKIILFASVGKELFYAKLGFDKMNTAMAIFKNREKVLEWGAGKPCIKLYVLSKCRY